MIKTFTTLGVMLAFSAGTLHAQTQADSLSGFDESAAIRASLSENFTGSELKVHLSHLKRNYINNKFGLQKHIEVPVNPAHKIAVAACVNEDFESSSAGLVTSTNQVSGWTVTRGYNTGVNNNCNLMGCCTSNPSESSIIVAPTGYLDPEIGSVYPIFSVFGTTAGDPNGPIANPQITSGMYGDNFIRINSNIAGDMSLERVSKTFAVSASNALFRFAFIAVQSSNHQCCDAGGFILKLTNVTTSTPLSSVSYSSSGVSASCSSSTGIAYYDVQTGTPAGANSGVIFNKWHVNYIDLTPYIGQNINIEVTAGDCTAGGHFAYAYFDAQCGPIEIDVNGQNKNTSCLTTATVSGPSNLNAYQWNGPAGFSSTAASFTTSTQGVYSLTIPQNPPYQPLQKNLNLVISPANVTLTATKPIICKGESTVLKAGGLDVYSWDGGSSNTPSLSVNPNANTTYTLTGTNSDNCPGFAMITVTVTECTGIEKAAADAEIVLFPNPNTGAFSLNVAKALNKAELTIRNNLGQLVYSQAIQKGENKIKTQGLASGVYYYSVTENSKTITQGKFSVE